MSKIDYDQVLTGCGELGAKLLDSGAETYRVEDSMKRLLAAYGVEGNVFVIPTCLIVSITDEEGKGHTWMRRLDTLKDANIEAIEQYNAMSRAVCADPPPPEKLPAMVEERSKNCKNYNNSTIILGYALCSLFFTLYFQGGPIECIVAMIASVLTGICVLRMSELKVNFFFKTVAAAVVIGVVVYGLRALGVPVDTSTAVIGGLMNLVPGMIFTNFMCDLISGDSLSGTSTFIRALLTAAAIALGIGLVLSIFQRVGLPTEGYTADMGFGVAAQCLIAFFACGGYCLLYNVHGERIPLCCLGGAIGCAVNLVTGLFMDNIYFRYMLASVIVSVYAEILARWRKCPTTAYRVVSFIPLVPGSKIYYAMYYIIMGDGELALESGIQALGMASCLAMGTLLVSTVVHTYSAWKKERRLKRSK